jgi:hypothetical protein
MESRKIHHPPDLSIKENIVLKKLYRLDIELNGNER